MTAPPLLEVEGLTISFASRRGEAAVVRDFNLVVERGETVAIVGESGSGKSVTAMSLLRLLPSPPARVAARRMQFGGRDLLALSARGMEAVRGREIAMVFQEPMTSLNPVLSIGAHLVETLRRHRPLGRNAARAEAIDLLRRVRIPDPERRIDEYPHRLSGGQRQRVMIALALAARPKLLIADEPTAALDVTVQAQILELLASLQDEFGIAILLISHDLPMVEDFAHRVVVMYAGAKLEEGPAARIFRNPAHPYTRGLLGAGPRHRREANGRRLPLEEIPGAVPDPRALPPGCLFAPRCPSAFERCRRDVPPLFATAPDRAAACFLVQPG